MYQSIKNENNNFPKSLQFRLPFFLEESLVHGCMFKNFIVILKTVRINALGAFVTGVRSSPFYDRQIYSEQVCFNGYSLVKPPPLVSLAGKIISSLLLHKSQDFFSQLTASCYKAEFEVKNFDFWNFAFEPESIDFFFF